MMNFEMMKKLFALVVLSGSLGIMDNLLAEGGSCATSVTQAPVEEPKPMEESTESTIEQAPVEEEKPAPTEE